MIRLFIPEVGRVLANSRMRYTAISPVILYLERLMPQPAPITYKAVSLDMVALTTLKDDCDAFGREVDENVSGKKIHALLINEAQLPRLRERFERLTYLADLSENFIYTNLELALGVWLPGPFVGFDQEHRDLLFRLKDRYHLSRLPRQVSNPQDRRSQ